VCSGRNLQLGFVEVLVCDCHLGDRANVFGTRRRMVKIFGEHERLELSSATVLRLAPQHRLPLRRHAAALDHGWRRTLKCCRTRAGGRNPAAGRRQDERRAIIDTLAQRYTQANARAIGGRRPPPCCRNCRQGMPSTMTAWIDPPLALLAELDTSRPLRCPIAPIRWRSERAREELTEVEWGRVLRRSRALGGPASAFSAAAHGCGRSLGADRAANDRGLFSISSPPARWAVNGELVAFAAAGLKHVQ